MTMRTAARCSARREDALEYADAITDTSRDVDDELFARVQLQYDDDTIAELTMIIAWENASSRFDRTSASRRKGSGSADRPERDGGSRMVASDSFAEFLREDSLRSAASQCGACSARPASSATG